MMDRIAPITDLHMHCIPGVDDGSGSVQMTMEMLRMSYEQGVRAVFCTPHDSAYACGRETVEKRFREIREVCSEELPDLRLFPGCEIYCAPVYMKEIIDGLREGRIPTMNGSRYVLAEFSAGRTDPESMKHCVRELQGAGYPVIIAHAERYQAVIDGIRTIRELKEMGCRIQINAYSVAEERNEKIRRLTREILEEELADFIGSDGHRTTHRPPKMETGVKEIFRICEGSYAFAICCGNAEELLEI